MKYPKIKSLFKRGDDFKFTEQLVSEFLSDFKDFYWVCLEKLDGMNIRIFCDYEKQEFKYFGRTDAAHIPEHLKPALDRVVSAAKENADSIKQAFAGIDKFILYGEGFGHKIQSGGLYLGENTDFNLFDCYSILPSEKGFWMDELKIQQLAGLLKTNTAPSFESMTVSEAVSMVKSGFSSKHGTARAEGLILKTRFPLFDSFGERLIFKLKTKDF